MPLLSLLQERQGNYRKKAIRDVQRIITLLRTRFYFDEVYICGSVLKDTFNTHSDIDIVIKGLSIENFFKAYGFMMEKSNFTIDLKPFEDLTDDFRDYVLTQGIKIG